MTFKCLFCPQFLGRRHSVLSSIVSSKFAIGVLSDSDMLPAAQRTRPTARIEDWQVDVVVQIAISQSAAVQNHRMVEQVVDYESTNL